LHLALLRVRVLVIVVAFLFVLRERVFVRVCCQGLGGFLGQDGLLVLVTVGSWMVPGLAQGWCSLVCYDRVGEGG